MDWTTEIHYQGLQLRTIHNLFAIARWRVSFDCLVTVWAYGGIYLVLCHARERQRPSDVYDLYRVGTSLFGIVWYCTTTVRTDLSFVLFYPIRILRLANGMTFMSMLPARLLARRLAKRFSSLNNLFLYGLFGRGNT